MENKDVEKIIELKEKLDLLSPYIKDAKIKNITKWAEEDIAEIYNIMRELKERNLLQYASKHKRENDIKIYKCGSIEKDILNVYRNIENELNYWRMVNLELKVNVIRKGDYDG